MAKRRSAPAPVEPMQLDKLRESLRAAGKMVKVEPLDPQPGKGPKRASTRSLRAQGRLRSEEGENTASLLLDADGILRWHFGSMLGPMDKGPGGARRAGKRRGESRAAAVEGEVVEQFNVEPLGFSEVNDFLLGWDESLSPQQGLHEWKETAAGKMELVPFQRRGREPARTLLIVHGTASNSANMIASLDNAAFIDPTDNKTFLAWAKGKYDLVLAFTHPTLSASPFVNALTLERLLADLPGRVDIVCHSRGGLVSRWWHEVVCRDPKRRGKIVFACAPLFGTSLAAPSRVRSALDYLTNVGNVVSNVLGAGSVLFPFFSIGQGLVRLMGAFTGVLSAVPAADIAIGLVPGLAAQSRITGHGEMVELQRFSSGAGQYYAISAHFQPEDFSIWSFWKSFTFTKLVATPITNALFPGPHDLVVDTTSMTMLDEALQIGKGTPKGERILAFGAGDHLNHATCFDDVRAVKFLKESLKA